MTTAIDTLLARARAALHEVPAAGGPDLDRTVGLFVTLRDADGDVRGSVGTTEPDRPLAELLPLLIRRAAQDDPRHPPVTDEEAGTLELELWLLPDPPRPVRGPAEVDPARDALRVRKGIFSGTLLPDVAAAGGWNAATALAYACRKAGLSAHAWREPDTEVQALLAIRAAAP